MSGIIVMVLGLMAMVIAGGIYIYIAYFKVEEYGGNEQIKDIKMQTAEYQMKHSDLQFGRLLGKGNQGEVFFAKYRSTSVAVKKIDCRKVDPDVIDEFVQEVNIWHRLRNQFITQFMGVCLEYPHLCIVTELAPRGSLFKILHDVDAAFSWPRRLRIASDLAQGMNYLHMFDQKQKIIHRDLKSLNVLITHEWRAKVADFGMTRFQAANRSMTTCGTPLWMAPEVIRKKKYDHKVDVYSYAICLWELYVRKIPYRSLGIPSKYLVLKIAKENLRPPIPRNMPPVYRGLMKKCWNHDPTGRPEFSEIVKYCKNMLSDASVVAHSPADDLKVAKVEKQEQKSIVANFEEGKWQMEAKNVKLKGTPQPYGLAKVYDAELKSEKARVTVWELDNAEQKDVTKKLEEISDLRHPRIGLFMGAYFEPEKVAIVTQIFERGTLLSTLLDPKMVLEWDTMLQFVIDICKTMAYLHGQKFIPKNFTPEMIFLNNHWRVKVDIANTPLAVLCGSRKGPEGMLSVWSAPETLKNPEHVSEASNVFTLGIILCQLFTRSLPYEEEKLTEELKTAIIAGKTPTLSPNVPAPLLALMKKCLGPMKSRGNFESVLRELIRIKKHGPPQIVVNHMTAKPYCKIATVFAFKSADAVQVEKEWGKLSGDKGCWIICNAEEDDLYLCDEDVFERNYAQLPDSKHEYHKVGTVLAREMEKPFALKTVDGVQYGVAGDFVVRSSESQSDGDAWVIDRKTFNKIYQEVETASK